MNFGFRPKNHSEFWRRPFFFFWRSPNFGRKKALNFGFRPRNHSEFWRRPFFFFWSSPNFGRKKALNFRAFRDISPQVSDKPSEIDSRSMKIRVKVVCTLLTLSKPPPPPPPFSKSWLRACQHQVKASDLSHYDIFAPTKNSSFEVSDDVIACDLWFGSPPPSNQKSWLCLCYGNTQYKTLNKMCSQIKHKKIISQK